MKIFLLTVTSLALTVSASGQNSNSSGIEAAKTRIKEVLSDKSYKPFYDTLIKDKKTAIAIAEPILFNIYGKKNIIKQKPYDCYLADGYWDITGNFPKGWVGGVFEIIISAKDGRVVKIIHGK